MNANIFQRSGETWKDISLVLSTGNPGDNATPSPLQPWMLGFYDPSSSYRSEGVIQGAATGRITGEKGEPITGATVRVKGTHNAAITDSNGFFKILNFANNGSIVISSMGHVSKEMAIKPGYYTIVLKQNSSALEEVVVTGYGS